MPHLNVASQVYCALLIILAGIAERVAFSVNEIFGRSNLNDKAGSNWPSRAATKRGKKRLPAMKGASMQTRMIVLPREDGFSVLIWEKWTEGSMRVRRFENRTVMIATLENLRLISLREARELKDYSFMDTCPLYSSEIDEAILAEHGFHRI
jgi:hypothetical protein